MPLNNIGNPFIIQNISSNT